MNSKQPDHTTYREWLYLEPDGELPAGQAARLRQHLAICHGCRQEHQQVLALHRMLTDSRISPDASFEREVMEGLPSAAWEARSPRSWIAAVVAVLVLATGAGLLIGFSTTEVQAAVPVTTLSAVWAMLSSSALAGAGLIAASWKGLGIALQQVLGESVWSMVAFGVLVLCLDLLLIWYLRSRRTAAAESESD